MKGKAMQFNVHNVQSVELKPITKAGLAIWRELIVIDEKGNRIEIVLFSNDESNLNVGVK